MAKLQDTILLEVEVPITFHAYPAVAETWDERGEDAFVEDIDFRDEDAIKVIAQALDSNEVREHLLDVAAEAFAENINFSGQGCPAWIK